MADTLQILLLEDSPADAQLTEWALRRGELDFQLRKVDNETDFIRELDEFPPDLILADFNLPAFDGLAAIRLAKERTPDTPVIVVSGSIGDELAVEVLRRGATDYVLKDRLHRLPAAVQRARTEALELKRRKKSEQELRDEKDFVSSVIESAGTIVAVFDCDGRFERINHSFTLITGLNATEVSGRLAWEVGLSPARVQGVEAMFQELRREGSARHEVSMIAHDGSLHKILWQGNVIRRAESSPDYIVMIGTDLTEMRGLEEQLEQSRRLDSLGRVAATIAHEFNNVLMGIVPYTEMLRRRPGDLANVQRSAEQIGQAVKRGQRITQEVTRFTRPSEPSLRPMDVNKWMSSFVEEMTAMLGEKFGIDLVPSPEDPWILADPLQLYQVFSNLVVNARDAMAEGGRIRMVVESIALPGEGGNVNISVGDTGSGIAPEVLSRIFEPLFTTKRSGTGLGLAVVLQAIVAHKGKIHAESELEKGTTFYVQLPRITSGGVEIGTPEVAVHS